MTTGEYTPLLRDGSNRSAPQHHPPILAHYYDITDMESWPIAGLLVLLDGQSQPVRAELHISDDVEQAVQEAAIRQARVVLQDKYLGGEPVPVRILETLQVREEMLVRLPPIGTRETTSTPTLAWKWRPHGMIGAAILALVALIWVISALISSVGSGDAVASETNTPEATSEQSDQATPAVAAENVTEGEGEESVAAAPASGSELPVSRNARGDLGIGMPVQVVPGLRIALRSEPGADRGIVVGEMSEGVVATIIGGPEHTQGDSDTIVWWFVRLPNTTEAWAAANTSQQTLLMPAQ